MKYTPKIIIKGIYNRLVLLFRLNILKTLYINFRTQPFRKAIKLPIFVYGKLIIHTLEGALVIDGPIKRGMIKIGYRYVDLWPTSYLPTQLWIAGKCIFRGRVVISGGAALFVQGTSAVLDIGNACIIGAGTWIKSRDNLIIGDHVYQYSVAEFRKIVHDAGFKIQKLKFAPGLINRHINAELVRK